MGRMHAYSIKMAVMLECDAVTLLCMERKPLFYTAFMHILKFCANK
ncbi:hypothetical protein HMPREF1992_01431 [Selenomonas sp. oral taxon 892 str. F0426]|nr:hypothetical protein HMPREF1992_01431 [Selenomonas sp. oral taxon 892 str. F0426]